MYKLDKDRTSILETCQGGGENITQTFNNTKRRKPKKMYVEGLANLESWLINKSKDKITRDGRDWWWCPKHMMDGKFGGVYMNHL